MEAAKPAVPLVRHHMPSVLASTHVHAHNPADTNSSNRESNGIGPSAEKPSYDSGTRGASSVCEAASLAVHARMQGNEETQLSGQLQSNSPSFRLHEEAIPVSTGNDGGIRAAGSGTKQYLIDSNSERRNVTRTGKGSGTGSGTGSGARHNLRHPIEMHKIPPASAATASSLRWIREVMWVPKPVPTMSTGTDGHEVARKTAAAVATLRFLKDMQGEHSEEQCLAVLLECSYDTAYAKASLKTKSERFPTMKVNDVVVICQNNRAGHHDVTGKRGRLLAKTAFECFDSYYFS